MHTFERHRYSDLETTALNRAPTSTNLVISLEDSNSRLLQIESLPKKAQHVPNPINVHELT